MLSSQKKVAIALSAGMFWLAHGIVQAGETTPSSSTTSVVMVPSSSSMTISGSSSSLAQEDVQTETTATSSTQEVEHDQVGLPVADRKEDKLVLDLPKILEKDYTSLAGVWKNAQGHLLLVTKSGQLYTKGANGGFLTLDGVDKEKSSERLAIFLKSQPNDVKAGHLYLVPAGQSFENPSQREFKDLSDKAKDRFILSDDFAKDWKDQVFYRISTKQTWDDETLSSSEASEVVPSSSTEIGNEEISSGTTATSSSSEVSSSPSQAVTVPSKTETELSQTPEEIKPTTSKTVVKRVLPKTGDRMIDCLPFLGGLSIITILVLYQKNRHSTKD